jgi:hypothetical protein
VLRELSLRPGEWAVVCEIPSDLPYNARGQLLKRVDYIRSLASSCQRRQWFVRLFPDWKLEAVQRDGATYARMVQVPRERTAEPGKRSRPSALAQPELASQPGGDAGE